MPQALKPLCLTQVGRIPFCILRTLPIPIFCPCPFLLSCLCSINNWFIMGKKMGIYPNKISLTGCKWSSLNAPGSDTPVAFTFGAHCGSSSLLSELASADRRRAGAFDEEIEIYVCSEALQDFWGHLSKQHFTSVTV